MELLIFFMVIGWMVGFLLTGMLYFSERGIGPFDQYGITLLVAILWPIGLPLHYIITRLFIRSE